MRSLDECRRRWAESQRDGGDIAALQRAVQLDGPRSPCEAGCRSVCWRAFLLFRGAAPADRRLVLRSAREDYEALRGRYLQFIKHPERLTEAAVDPLADDPESPWDAFRRDEVVRAEILQDVRRLPDDPFYHREDIQTLILDILFVFCKQNPGVGGYRQGMHELLAPIVHVLSTDALPVDADRPPPAVSEEDRDMLETLDGRFVEHDAYALFAKIMDRASAFYETSGGPPQLVPAAAAAAAAATVAAAAAADASSIVPAADLFPVPAPAVVEESAIVELSKEIHEGTLMKVDPELATHLKAIEILPQIFLIRWIRLLFGREFPFDQHLVLWDHMFALDPQLRLVPLISVAMLLRIRWQLLDADYSAALQALLKYPAPQPPYGPHTFVGDAVYLRDHLDTAGGASLVLKYTGRSPARVLSPASSSPGGSTASRPSTPAAAFAAGLGSLRSRTLKAARSPLRLGKHEADAAGEDAAGAEPAHAASSAMASPPPPPALRFVQRRENVEALFQGAAKGVLERSEKLGINQAVRDAVGEIRRNMAQGFQEARQAAKQTHRASSSGSGSGSGSGGGGGAGFFPSSSTAERLAEMERRNRQLARMLDETVASLKAVAGESSVGGGADVAAGVEMREQPPPWVEAVELAAAKVQFVKVYLEDASLVLPSDDAPDTAASSSASDERSETGRPDSKLLDSNTQAPVALMPAAEVDAGTPSPGQGLLPHPRRSGKQADMDGDRTTGTEGNGNPLGGGSGGVSSSTTAAPPPRRPSPVPPSTPPAAPPLVDDRRSLLKSETEAAAAVAAAAATTSGTTTTTAATRSSLAESSFAWMLEPGDDPPPAASRSSHLSPPPRASASSQQRGPSPSPSSPRTTPRGGGGGSSSSSRARHAFLFGEAVSQSPLGAASGSDPLATEDVFGPEPLRRALPRDQA